MIRVVLQRRADDLHVLLLLFHHIAFDGWSAEIFTRELAALYGALSHGEPSPLPELPIQYADFARWQHQQADRGAFAGQIDYWRRQLADLPALELPADYSRPQATLIDGSRHPVALPAPLLERAKRFARDEEATLHMLLLAGFGGLLHRHSGQTDFGIGVPVAGRTDPAAEPLVGCFINLLVQRADFSGDPSFRTLLRRTRQTALAAHGHQDVSFAEVVEALQPERHVNRAPLAQALFQLRNMPRQAVAPIAGLRIEPMTIDPGFTGGQDLSLELEETPDGLSGAFIFSTDLFAPATIELIAGHFEVLLGAALDSPDTRFSRLPMMSESERHRLLMEYSGTAANFPEEVCLHQLVESQVDRTPDAIALVFEDKELTYGELEQRANQLAHELQHHGIGPDVLVGLCVERSFEAIVSILAVLKAGGAFLPLDSSLPEARLRFMLDDARPALILIQRHLAAHFPPVTVPLLCVDANQDEHITARVASSVGPEHLAYVLYTSGSTGQPKGVMIEHRAICAFTQSTNERWPFYPEDVVVMNTSFLFDVSVIEIFEALTTGTRLVMPRPDGEGDPAYLARLMETCRVTIFHAVPSLLRAMLGERVFRQNRSLRRILTGGEVVPVDLPADLIAVFDADVFNRYGPAETTISVTSWTCRRNDPYRSVSIGRPHQNVQVYVLDDRLDLVPHGVPGELYIGGAQLARGYLRRPALTSERFLPNPFSEVPGARLYRTGDLVRWRSDGALEFLGRIDHQVKLRGQRIELGEIEAVLHRHESVRACVVTVWEPASGDQRLVAYVVGEADVVSPSVLRAHLKTWLPMHMVPSHFVALSRLPLLRSGKIDRRALPAPAGLPDERTDFEPPGTPTERALAEVWAGLLQVERVSRTDHFFELGGHSLLAMNVIGRIRDRFDLEVSLVSFFAGPTLAGLAKTIDQGLPDVTASPLEDRPNANVESDAATEHRRDTARSLGTRASRELPPRMQPSPGDPIPRRDVAGPAVLSSAQQRLWFIDQLEEGLPLYNLATGSRLVGPVDEHALQKALDALVERHSVLRTTVRATPDGPLQKVQPPRPVPFDVLDVRDRPASARFDAAMAVLAEAAQMRFDLTADLLLRARLVRLADQEHVLGLTMHHIASDGWSIGILWQELSACYSAFTERHSPALPPLPIQYADYAVWQRARLADPRMAAQLDYWKRQLAGVTPLELPTDRPRPPLQSYRGASYEHVLPAQLTAGLEELARREHTTLFMVLLAAYETLLYRYTGQTDISVGSPIAGRNRSEIEGLIGFFVNSLVLRTELSGEWSFRDLLGRVREIALAAYDHQDVPFDQIVEALKPPRDRSRAPLFQTMLVLQNLPPDEQQWSGLTAEPLSLDTRHAKFDLVTHVLPRDDTLRIRFNYATDLFDGGTMQRLAGHFATLLEGIVAAPDTQLRQLPLMTAAERHESGRWNDLRQRRSGELRVHRLYEEQARRTSGATALIDGVAAWTYDDLNRRANRCAHALQALVTRPRAGIDARSDVPPLSGGMRIGLCLERSASMVVGMLGALKSGGAYVPLDPAYPAERLRVMIEDATLSAIVTDAVHGETIESLGTSVPVLRLDGDRLAAYPYTDLPDAPATPERSSGQAPAYVIYTSGSTGRPKGVVVPHCAVVHLVRETDYVALGADDVIAQAANASFDAMTFEVWGALLNGARLLILPRDVLLSPRRLAEALRERDVTTLFLTTALFDHVAQEIPGAFGPLKTVLFGGERVQPRWVRAVLQADRPTRLLHVYGPTETTTFAAWHEVDDVDEDTTNVPIGKPVAGTTLWVLDTEANMQPVPVGLDGELYIGGAGVALEYMNRPELTAERFVPDPFGEDASARLYRTGDRVRRLPGGALEFRGRLDRQIKLRGFRIEPGEIEAALESHPAVQKADVRLAEAGSELARLIAYVGAAGDPVSEAALRAHVRQLLPEYMVPAAVVVKDALPLTASGKVDHGALQVPDADLQQAAPSNTPRDALETMLLRIWEEALDRRPVGTCDNFFELGGHSLLAARLFSRLEAQLGRRLPLALLFEAPTIATLAAEIRKTESNAQWSSLVLVEPCRNPAAPALFCVHGAGGNVLDQRGLAQRLSSVCTWYGIQAIGLDGEQKPLEKIEDMAARYLREVHLVQPDGPYVFAGWSFGGTVALEMAQQARQAGETVALLVLFDSGVPSQALGWPKRLPYLALRYFKRHAGAVVQGTYLLQLFRHGTRHAPGPRGAPGAQMRPPDETFWRIHDRVLRACKIALRTYRPAIYRGPAVLIRMSNRARRLQRLQNILRRLLCWELILPELETLELRGAHHMLLEEPLVDEAAAFLRARLTALPDDRSEQ